MKKPPKIRDYLLDKQFEKNNIVNPTQLAQTDIYQYGITPSSVSTLYGGSESLAARTRYQIYDKWQEMGMAAASALSILVTAALGADELTGQQIYIEKHPSILNNKTLCQLVDDIDNVISPIINSTVSTTGFLLAQYGDSYLRPYVEKNVGVVDYYADELVYPPLVIAHEQGSKTVGVSVMSNNNKDGPFEQLTALQMVRFKMPRTQYVPQYGVMQKSLKFSLVEDKLSNLPIMPSDVGGSLLFPAEKYYGFLEPCLLAMVGQRFLDSLDERIIAYNNDGMSKDQQKRFGQDIQDLFKRSQRLSEESLKQKKPFLQRIFHFLPIFNEKQRFDQINIQSTRNGTINIEDTIFFAQLFYGQLGVDISQVGFANMLAGSSFGDGGLFRTSAQTAEKARIIRSTLLGAQQGYHQLIDIHCYYKYGGTFSKNNRPYILRSYGSLSAAEAEKSRTKMDNSNASLLDLQVFAQLKESGLSEDAIFNFISQRLGYSEDEAMILAKDLKGGSAAPVENEEV